MKKLFLFLALILGIFTGNPGISHATVQNTTNSVTYNGDGSSTSFLFNNNVYLSTDLNVYTDVVATGIITLLTLNTNYSVTLTPISGTTGAYTATVSLAGGSYPFGALPIGTNLIIVRNIPYTQLINISDYSSTPAATWNQGFDRATILSQQLNNLINTRGVLQPVSGTSSISLPTPIANLNLCWDPTGLFLTNCSTTSSIAIPIVTAGYVNGSSLTGSGTLTNLTTTALSTGTLITSNNVGIGTTLINRGKLVVHTGTNNNVVIEESSLVGGTSGSAIQGINDAQNSANTLTISGSPLLLNGNVGIGTLIAGQSLVVNGTVQSQGISLPTTIYNYGTSLTTGTAQLATLKIAYGNLPSNGTQTITNLPFTSSSSYSLIAYPNTASATYCNITNNSGSSCTTVCPASGGYWIAIGT